MLRMSRGDEEMAIEKKSLIGKKSTAAPAPKKMQKAKGKVDTAKPDASKVVAALKVGFY
jgi:hypothetical protein